MFQDFSLTLQPKLPGCQGNIYRSLAKAEKQASQVNGVDLAT